MASFGRSEPALPSFPDREESPPPPQEHASGDSIVGLQPIVSGLERQNTRSAAAYLHRISKDYQDKELNPPLPAVLVTASDSRTPVDYVYLSIDPAASALHRPDWLEDLRRILCEAQGFGPERRSAMDRTGVFPGGFRGPAGVSPAATEPVLGPSLCRHPGTPNQQGLEASGVWRHLLWRSPVAQRAPAYDGPHVLCRWTVSLCPTNLRYWAGHTRASRDLGGQTHPGSLFSRQVWTYSPAFQPPWVGRGCVCDGFRVLGGHTPGYACPFFCLYRLSAIKVLCGVQSHLSVHDEHGRYSDQPSLPHLSCP